MMLDSDFRLLSLVSSTSQSMGRTFCLLALSLCFTDISHAALAPAEAIDRLNAGQSADLIIEYDADGIEAAAAGMRKRTPHQLDDAKVLNFKEGRYKALKKEVDQAMIRPEIQTIADYSHLPMTFKRFKSKAALNAYLANVKVKAVYPNKALHRLLAQSLPLINQPMVLSAGEQGVGTTVAVIDDGIDYTNAAFGSCVAPGSSASCKVVSAINFGTGTVDNSHGTNVSAIILGVAPSSKIAMINVFSGVSAYTSDVIAGINWAITNQSTYNIVAINMSLGDGSKNTAACPSGNPFYTVVTSARNAGISVIAASGNEAYTNAISSPACTPGIISVGAVYDANLGGLTWGNNLCTDVNTAADRVACFSDSASFLTILAPGAMITAAGITSGGTSQATPHVAGAVAVLRSAYPSETLAQTELRLTSTGLPITDSRNGIVKPRLNLLDAARPLNDGFINRFALAGSSGNITGLAVLASKESGEPDHAGIIGAHSVWWKWTAPAAGQLSLDTHGSNFDTLLAVYSGINVSALTLINANDNDGSIGNTSGLLFQAQAGREYEVAVDGAYGAQGTVAINWSLNTTASSNLSVSFTGPGSISLGTPSNYMLTVHNAGPQTATNVLATLALPAGASFVSGTNGCSVNGSTVSCRAGTLLNNGLQTFAIQILWTSMTGSQPLTANTSSDLPDSVITDNSVSIQVALSPITSSGDNNDVPTLPEWGLLLMASCMLGLVMKARRDVG